MNIFVWLKQKALGLLGLAETDLVQNTERLTFVSDRDSITKNRIHEYNIWYEGSGDELLNFYTNNNTINYNYEPFYDRNKRNYFWAINSTEDDIKRTHSGQPRNIIDTLVGIMPFPVITGGKLDNKDDAVHKNLNAIIKEAGLRRVYKQEQIPLTLIEGWGCYKVIWDKAFSTYPAVVYYRADQVDFVVKQHRIIACIFRDYYVNDKRQYMLAETRRFEIRDGKRYTVIENELFDVTGTDGEEITKVGFNNVPELEGTQERIEIGPDAPLFAVPCIFFENTAPVGGYGRSIFQGKLDLFDDLDQCLSQAANSVRKSTPIEYFNSEFLERDRNGMPKQPHAYDRKYTLYEGMPNSNGETTGNPVQVTQPQVNFQQYSDHAVQILLQIVNGVMSPATLGIDISKKDNAEAQREKEKVTIFTRNMIIEEETEILKDLCSQLLCAKEFMDTDQITVREYDISVKFSEFADDSFENKLKVLGEAFDSENISEEMYINKLYGNTLSRADYDKEIAWLKEHHTKPRDEGMQGMSGGGENAQGMLGNMMGGGEDDGSDGEEEI